MVGLGDSKKKGIETKESQTHLKILLMQTNKESTLRDLSNVSESLKTCLKPTNKWYYSNSNRQSVCDAVEYFLGKLVASTLLCQKSGKNKKLFIVLL